MSPKPLPPITRRLALLLKINIGVLALALVGDVYSWSEYSNLAPDVDASDRLLPSDILNFAISIIQVVLIIYLGITFLRWIYRANANLRVASQEPMSFTPGWSVGWYFVPIANLFKPYQAMKEIWRVAHRGTPSRASILGWWWFLWIVSNYVDRISIKLAVRAMRAGSSESYTISAIADGASDAIDIALNVVALVLVTAIARAYHVNYDKPVAALDEKTPLSSSDPLGPPLST